MKKKIKAIEVKDPVYNISYRFLIGATDEILESYMRQEFGEVAAHMACEKPLADVKCVSMACGCCCVIAIRHSDPASPEFIATLAHELVHASWYASMSRGLNFSHNQDEQQAYIVSFLVMELFKRNLKKWNKKKKRSP